MSYQPSAKFDDWLKAWRSWAGTRKRGKMAQFIVHKLEENKQATWLDITKGKFQLTEWHTIAEEWFRQKPRSSDQVDAPCMLRKGLPRAFPGLEEVKSESIKEGTQYRSRVFQAPQALLQEVLLYINKPVFTNTAFVPNGPSTSVFQQQAPSVHYSTPHPHINSTGPISINGLPQQPFLSPTVKLEDQTVDVMNSPASSDTAHSPYDNGMVYPSNYDGHTSPYNGGGSPYSADGPSPVNGVFPITSTSGMGDMLQPGFQVPVSDADGWSSPANYSPHNSESYYSSHSPDPMYQQQGGGELALLFSGELPSGSKWLSFNSQARPSYMHQVEAVQGHNPMALTAIIPKHDIPETVLLQVVSNGQLVAQTEFTYYANAQYNSDMLFHYLTQSFPQYFPDVSMGGNMDMGGGDVGAGDSGGFYFSGNVPSTSYSLLLGACRLGIEQLVYATLELKSMFGINGHQLTKAHDLAEENGHSNLARVLKGLADVYEITSKGEGEDKTPAVQTEDGRKVLQELEHATDPKDCAEKVLGRLSSIARMEQRSKLEEQRDSNPSTPTEIPERPDGIRRSSSNKLRRQSKREDEDLLLPPTTEIHSRGSIAELNDTVAPLSARPRVTGSVRQRRMLIATHSDAADSAVSMSFDGDSNEYCAEVARRNSARDASLGLFKFGTESEGISVKINAESGYTLASSLQYECAYQVTDDYPPNSDPLNIIFRAGDKIVQIGDTSVKDKGPDEFADLLQQAGMKDETSIRIIPRLSPPPNTTSLSLGYGSLDVGDRAVLPRRQSEQQLMSSLAMKVSNLLSMKPPGPKRTVTIPRTANGFGFKLTGGNAVGLFVSEVTAGRDEVKVGDQVLEIGGEPTLEMTHYAALELLKGAKDKLQLKVMENNAKFQAILVQFEYESFYIRTHIDHTPSESKDMTLQDGGLARVVNCTHDPNYWLAWSVDSSTGADTVLRRIPAPHKAHGQFGKHVYETVPTSDIQTAITA